MRTRGKPHTQDPAVGRAVLAFVRQHGPTSVPEIVRGTRLSKTKVQLFVNKCRSLKKVGGMGTWNSPRRYVVEETA